MKKKIDELIGRKFAISAGVLMTRVFSTPLEPNQRRCAFAAGPAINRGKVAPTHPASKFDMVGLGFTPGREWKGPVDVFVEEMRDGQTKVWTSCSFWADSLTAPLYLLTDDPNVCFSFDGYSLVPLTGDPGDRVEGNKRAHKRLRESALKLPLEDVEQHRMM